MIVAILFGLVAAAVAAPQHPPHGPHGPHGRHYGGLNFGSSFEPSFDHFGNEFFNANKFWSELDAQLRMVDEMLANLNKRFTASSDAKIEGEDYIITIPLSSFDEKDIAVKAKEGFLMVQAIHHMPGGGESIYIDAKTLPPNVNVAGTWTFSPEKILKIVFPLKKTESSSDIPVITSTVASTETQFENETQAPFNQDREEMDNESPEAIDADVGLGDLDKTNALFTNEIPRNRVEATTYAVDLKDEVEFVPVRYNK